MASPDLENMTISGRSCGPLQVLSEYHPATAAAVVTDDDDECIKDAIAVPRRSINDIAGVSCYRNGGENLPTEAANCIHSLCKVAALLSLHLSSLATLTRRK